MRRSFTQSWFLQSLAQPPLKLSQARTSTLRSPSSDHSAISTAPTREQCRLRTQVECPALSCFQCTSIAILKHSRYSVFAKELFPILWHFPQWSATESRRYCQPEMTSRRLLSRRSE